MAKKALVLSGGGIKGAWQVGATQAVIEKNYVPLTIYGTSIGAINAGLIASKTTGWFHLYSKKYDHDEALSRALREAVNDTVEFWHEIYDFKSIGSKKGKLKIGLEIISGKFNGFFNLEKFDKLIRKEITREKIHQSPIRIFVSYVQTDTGELKFATNESENIVEEILASTKIPVSMKEHKINNKYCIDGGTRETVPLGKAIEDGHDELVIVSCQPEKKMFSPIDHSDFSELVERSLSILLDEGITNDIRPNLKLIDLINQMIKLGVMPEKYKHVDYWYLCPTTSLDYEISTFREEDITNMISLGYDYAWRTFDPKKPGSEK